MEGYAGRHILVLGGGGFLGSHIVEAALASGASACVIDGFLPETGNHREYIVGLSGDLEVMDRRIEDVGDLDERIDAADLVVDSMGFTRHLTGIQNPRHDIETNLLSHLTLLEGLRRRPGAHVVYLGSRSQYGGHHAGIVGEDTAQNPRDPQGVAKSAAEHLFRIYAPLVPCDVVSLRLNNCFGERQVYRGSDLGLISGFLVHLFKGETIDVYESDDRILDLVYARDAAQVVLLLGRNLPTGFTAFNMAGHTLTVKQLMDRLIPLTGSRGGYRVVPAPNARHLASGGTVSEERLRQHLGCIAYTDLETGLQRMVDWFLQNEAAWR